MGAGARYDEMAAEKAAVAAPAPKKAEPPKPEMPKPAPKVAEKPKAKGRR